MKKKIPNKFKLFGSTINVVFDDEYCNNKELYGEADYAKHKITLSTSQGISELSEDRVIETFYHEKVHAILDAMSERELSNNEQFVDIFAKLLKQSDETEIHGKE